MGARRMVFDSVAVYARSASVDGSLVERQVAHCRKLAEVRGWTVAGVYADGGHSGLDADRPEYRRLVKDVHDGRYGLVLAYTPMVVSRAAAEVRFFAAVCSGLGVRTLLHAGSELPEGSPLVAEELFRL